MVRWQSSGPAPPSCGHRRAAHQARVRRLHGQQLRGRYAGKGTEIAHQVAVVVVAALHGHGQPIQLRLPLLEAEGPVEARNAGVEPGPHAHALGEAALELPGAQASLGGQGFERVRGAAAGQQRGQQAVERALGRVGGPAAQGPQQKLLHQRQHTGVVGGFGQLVFHFRDAGAKQGAALDGEIEQLLHRHAQQAVQAAGPEGRTHHQVVGRKMQVDARHLRPHHNAARRPDFAPLPVVEGAHGIARVEVQPLLRRGRHGLRGLRGGEAVVTHVHQHVVLHVGPQGQRRLLEAKNHR